MRHNIDQRDQQYKLTDNSNNNRVYSFSKWGKCHLAGNLDTEEEQTTQINLKHWCSKSDKICISSKNAYKYSGNKLYRSPEKYRIWQTGDQKQTKSFFYSVCIFGTVIITGNWLCSLRNSLKRKHGKLHNTGQDGHGSHCNITAVPKQGWIKADSYNTFTWLHDKSSKSQCDTGKNNFCLQMEMLFPEVKLCLFAAEE